MTNFAFLIFYNFVFFYLYNRCLKKRFQTRWSQLSLAWFTFFFSVLFDTSKYCLASFSFLSLFHLLYGLLEQQNPLPDTLCLRSLDLVFSFGFGDLFQSLSGKKCFVFFLQERFWIVLIALFYFIFIFWTVKS